MKKVKINKNNDVECRIYKPQFSLNELTHDEEIVFYTKEKVLQDVCEINEGLVKRINGLKRENHSLQLRNLTLELEMELEFIKSKKIMDC